MAKKISYTPEQTRMMNVLKAVASTKGTISYSELVTRAKLKLNMEEPYDRDLIGGMLGELSRMEFEQGRPMISSIVTHAGNSLPGGGFFDLAEELYGVPLNNADSRMIFACNEMNKTHTYWAGK